jgi:4-amino-4-deoxy-L-arabinose transferase-like glycosyltransferase
MPPVRMLAGRTRLLTGWGAAIVLVALWWTMAVTAVAGKSTGFDEVGHLTAGYSYWLTGDFRLQPEGGNLSVRWATLPLLTGPWRFPSRDQDAWRQFDVYAMGYHFFYGVGNDVQAMLLRARAAMAVLGAALGLVVYGWSRRLFGSGGGIVSVALFAFCPTLLAIGPLVTSDTPVALFFAASAWAVWELLQAVSARTVVVASLALAGICLAKPSALLMGPIALLLIALRVADGRPLPLGGGREVRSRLGQLAVLAATMALVSAIVLLIVWAFYGFRYSLFATDDHTPLDWDGMLAGAGGAAPPLELARRLRVLPEAYLYGVAWVMRYAATRPAFLNGEHSWIGWSSFFPYSALVKTPLPLLVLVIAGAAGAVIGRPDPASPARRRIRANLYRTAPLWALLAVYWAAAISSNLNIGHRHLLPTYPAMLVLAGGLVVWLARSTATRIVVALVALAYALESGRTWPHYLAYFNQIAGGPRHAYRHMVDSSLDWGQDLPGLADWLRRNPPGATQVYLAYFGSGSPEYYGISSRRLPGYFDTWRRRDEWYALTGGIYAVSATMLQTVYTMVPGPWCVPYEELYQTGLTTLRAIADPSGDLAAREARMRTFLANEWILFDHLRFARLAAYLRRREPDDDIGHSILIYRLTEAQVREALYGPPAELLPDIQVLGAKR